jgi:hypothetical protein
MYRPDGSDRISRGSCLPSKFRTTVILEGYTPLPWPTSRR